MSHKKCKVDHAPLESVGGCSAPSYRPWARSWRTTNVWRRASATYGYLPSRKASLPFGWYQIILPGDRGTCVSTTCSGLLDGAAAGIWTCKSSTLNHSASKPHQRAINGLITALSKNLLATWKKFQNAVNSNVAGVWFRYMHWSHSSFTASHRSVPINQHLHSHSHHWPAEATAKLVSSSN